MLRPSMSTTPGASAVKSVVRRKSSAFSIARGRRHGFGCEICPKIMAHSLQRLDFRPHAVVNGDAVAAVLFEQTCEFMTRQSNRDVVISPLGVDDKVHDALQFGIAGGAVDQTIDLDSDKDL